MGKYLKICALIMGCGLAFGCATKQNSTNDDQLRVERFRRSYEAALDEDQAQASRQLLRKARSAIGTPYVRGGSSPGGFDCSGFVCWAYKSVGVDLPRTAREQSVVGERIKNQEDMRAGDIVAFRHPAGATTRAFTWATGNSSTARVVVPPCGSTLSAIPISAAPFWARAA